MRGTHSIVVLMAEDDSEDRMLVQEAWEESRGPGKLLFVTDGEDLMDYLLGHGEYSDRVQHPMPDLILLDLNMPKKDGREALRDIKVNADLMRIPVVVLTSSNAEEDVLRSYELGANSYITKPATFGKLVDVMKLLGDYWLGMVELPTVIHASKNDGIVGGEKGRRP